jgi:hypothetical protein
MAQNGSTKEPTPSPAGNSPTGPFKTARPALRPVHPASPWKNPLQTGLCHLHRHALSRLWPAKSPITIPNASGRSATSGLWFWIPRGSGACLLPFRPFRPECTCTFREKSSLGSHLAYCIAWLDITDAHPLAGSTDRHVGAKITCCMCFGSPPMCLLSVTAIDAPVLRDRRRGQCVVGGFIATPLFLGNNAPSLMQPQGLIQFSPTWQS